MYQVWTNKGFGIKPLQKCLLNKDGDYVGIVDGTLYPKEHHYASRQYKAIVLEPDEENFTGMYHLDVGVFDDDHELNRKNWKARYKGCFVTVEAAHKCGGLQIYRCVELNEYFSGNELELLEDDSGEWTKYDNASV